jgi:two-component system sensor histidine kinase DesK
MKSTKSGGPAEPGWIAGQSAWTRGWRRVVFPGVFLVYLLSVLAAVAKYSSGLAAVAGYAILLAFCACYMIIQPDAAGSARGRRFWVLFGALAVLFAAEIPFARANAFIMCVYLAVLSVARLGARAAPVVFVMTLLAVLVPWSVPSWHDGFATSWETGAAIAIPATALAMFGFFRVLRGNRELVEARMELARLAAENERSRIARDLHDLLGHSLTTITVKAGLARRLGAADVEGALREIGEVEELSRRALGEVRMAVANYRDVTLAGELANGRELLRSAGIAADLPRAVDVVDPHHQELFGWVVREGLTNVVRHSRARACAVRLTRSSVEIADDGTGGSSANGATAGGSGLSGLRERVEAASGTVDAGPASPHGWRLHVSVPAGTGLSGRVLT